MVYLAILLNDFCFFFDFVIHTLFVTKYWNLAKKIQAVAQGSSSAHENSWLGKAKPIFIVQICLLVCVSVLDAVQRYWALFKSSDSSPLNFRDSLLLYKVLCFIPGLIVCLVLADAFRRLKLAERRISIQPSIRLS